MSFLASTVNDEFEVIDEPLELPSWSSFFPNIGPVITPLAMTVEITSNDTSSPRLTENPYQICSFHISFCPLLFKYRC